MSLICRQPDRMAHAIFRQLTRALQNIYSDDLHQCVWNVSEVVYIGWFRCLMTAMLHHSIYAALYSGLLSKLLPNHFPQTNGNSETPAHSNLNFNTVGMGGFPETDPQGFINYVSKTYGVVGLILYLPWHFPYNFRLILYDENLTGWYFNIANTIYHK